MNQRDELIALGLIKPACDMTKTAFVKAQKKRAQRRAALVVEEKTVKKGEAK